MVLAETMVLSELQPNPMRGYSFTTRPKHLGVFANHGHNCAVALYPIDEWRPGMEWTRDRGALYTMAMSSSGNAASGETVHVGGLPQWCPVPQRVLDSLFSNTRPGFTLCVYGAQILALYVGDPSVSPFSVEGAVSK